MKWTIFSVLGLAMACHSGGSSSISIGEIRTPKIQFTTPANGESSVSKDIVIQAIFSEPLPNALLNPANFTLHLGVNQIAGAVEVMEATAIFRPASPLKSSTQYRARVLEHEWAFTVADTSSPSIFSTLPIPGAQFADGSTIQVTFSEEIQPSSISNSSFFVQGPSGNVPGSISYHHQKASFVAATALESTSLYTATITQAIQDLAGNPLASDYVWTFLSRDTAAPIVLSTSPETGTSNIDLNVTISASFNEPINPETIHAASLFVTDESGTNIPGTISYDETTRTANMVFDVAPYTRLGLNTQYTATLRSSIRDIWGNPLANDYTWTFRTRKGWSGAELLENLAEEGSSIAADYDAARNLFHVVWQQRALNASSPNDVRHNQVSPYAPDPQAHVSLTVDRGIVTNLSLAVDSQGRAFATWLQQINGLPKSRLLFNQIAAAPSPVFWDIEATGTIDFLQDPNHSAGAPQLLFGTGNQKFVIWQFQPGAGSDAVVSQFSSANNNWQEPNSLKTVDANPVSPRIEIGADGTAFAIFRQNNNFNSPLGLFLNFKAMNESGWTAARTTQVNDPGFATGSLGSNYRVAPLSDGTALVLWSQSMTPGSAQSILARRVIPFYANNTVLAGPVTAIDVDGSASTFEAVLHRVAVTANDNVHCIFQQRAPNSAFRFNVVHRRYVGGVWVPINGAEDPDVFIDEDAQVNSRDATSPQITVDAEGTAYAVWAQLGPNFNSYNIVVRIRNASGWGPFQYVDADGIAEAQNANNPVIALDPVSKKFAVFWQQFLSGENVFSIFGNRFE